MTPEYRLHLKRVRSLLAPNSVSELDMIHRYCLADFRTGKLIMGCVDPVDIRGEFDNGPPHWITLDMTTKALPNANADP
jgi:hypothetical protein